MHPRAAVTTGKGQPVSSPLSICYVSQEYPEETGWGGIGTYVYEMAHGLARAGHRVVVLSRALAQPQRYVEAEGVTVYRILPRFTPNRWPFLWRLNRLWEGYRLAVAEALRHIVREHRVELIEAPDLHSEPLLFRLARPRRPRLVVRLHSGNRVVGPIAPHFSFRQQLDDLAERLALSLASAVTSPSRAALRDRDPAFPLPSRRCEVLPNPVDTDLFRPPDGSRLPADAEVLYLGRLLPSKGLDVLMRALPLVLEAVPDALFTLVGAGMGKPGSGVEKLPQGLPPHLVDRVRVMSYLPRGHLPVLYARATVCVVPSRWEQFGYSCAEAMACGKAVVASRIGGLAEIVEDGMSGLLVPPGDPEALAMATVKLLRDRQLRDQMAQAGRRRIEESFSSRVVVPQFVDFYRQVCCS